MNVIGVIAEYNPFHNGHIYHLQEIKNIDKEAIVIAVINGYFMQRGEVSILSKEDKTKIALDNGIDVVIELPYIFGTQSADVFAYNAIKLLNELKINKIVFGSESNNVDLLNKIVDIELNDSEYEVRVKKYLDEGLNYPTALAKALDIKMDITSPNDLLGISYIKAIRKINPKIEATTIKRTNDYHNKILDEDIVSASNIREKIALGKDISRYIPKNVLDKIINIDYQELFDLLKFKILTDGNLERYLDVDEGIENRILKYIKECNTYEDLVYFLKTKRYTYNKINRMLMHILVGLTKKDNIKAKIDYIKVLGFNTRGQTYLNNIRKDISIPTKIDKNSIVYKYELLASYIYSKVSHIDTNSFDIQNIPIRKEL